MSLPSALRSIAMTLWVGGLWVVGTLVAVLLFRYLDNRTAGMLAGKMFTAMAWVGIVCGLFILLTDIWQTGLRAVRDAAFWLVLGMLLLTLINHFAVFPIISELRAGASKTAEGLFGGGFDTWHTISSLIYLVQSIFGLLLVARDR
jgi:hypothetical protein